MKNFKITKDYELLLMMAFRYSLGRRTYVISFIVKELLNNWEQFADERKQQFKREIEEHKRLFDGLGDNCDEREWNKILEA